MPIFKTNFFSSGILLNDGKFNFHFESFPIMAQLSTVNDLVIDDFNIDGIKDILICGNSNDAEVGTGNYDCTAVLLLNGKGGGQFNAEPKSVFETNIEGEVRKIIRIENKSFILLKNNEAAQVIKNY